MSFNVNWNTLETDSLRSWTIELLTDALNSGKRPNVLASDITIKDLNFGKVAPKFEILEIGELDKDRFRSIFKINYSGDFHLTLHTKVQANPLKIYGDNSLEREMSSDSPFVTPDFLLSTDPFNLPLDLKLSDLKILGIGIIVYSKTKGLTLVFRNDPLDSIKVSSTFDSVQVLANFLQKQIETQIRDLFRETLPTLIHKFSLKYTSPFNNNDFIDNLKDHLKDQANSYSLDTLELGSVSANNLSKLARLYSSRETLDLKIPKLKRVVQRNHLEKFNKNLFPNLVNSLYSNLDLPSSACVNPNSNSIPAELIVDNDFKQVDKILREISTIQSQSFKSASNDHRRAKRRTIKLGKSKKSADADANVSAINLSTMSNVSAANLSTEFDTTEVLSDTSTVLEETTVMHHPTPVKSDARPVLRSRYSGDKYTISCPSPLNSSSSFVGSVGLGNSYYNFGTGHSILASPLRRELIASVASEEKKVAVKKSHNRIDIDQINEKLQREMKAYKDARSASQLRREKADAPEAAFEMPPPPYHQLARARV